MIIYRIENKLNGKNYIGQTTQTLEHRIKQHIYSRSKVGKVMADVGEENICISVVEELEDKDMADKRERYWISYYDSIKNGYNTLVGGKPTKEEMKMLSKFPKRKTKLKRKKEKKHTTIIKEKKPIMNKKESKKKKPIIDEKIPIDDNILKEAFILLACGVL